MEKLKTDVAVVGTGAAGMTAALTAAESGAGVILFDKRGVAGGFSNIPVGGILCVASRYQPAPAYPGKEEVFRALAGYNHWRGNARLLRAFIEKTAGTVDWLEQQGVAFEPVPAEPPRSTFPGGLFTQIHIKGHAFALMKALRARAAEKGIGMRLDTTVKKLLVQNGRVSGLMAEDKEGNIIGVNAGAVVIATGGFSASPEMVKRYAGFELEKEVFPLIDLGHTGDGIRMAWEAGAVPDGMGLHLYYGVPTLLIPKSQLHLASMQPYLWLNQQGERFVDETIPNPVYLANALARQPGRCAYLVFDGATRRHMEEEGIDAKSPWMKVDRLENLDGQIKAAREKGLEHLFMAESLEELAAATGMDHGRMLRSVQEYNGYCENGYDALFFKGARFLRPVKEPKFYAFRLLLGCHGSLGGIKINERAEALDKHDKAIPGLYAAGYDACSLYGDTADYNWLVPGGAYSFALNSGCIAGESAAAYLNGKA